MQSWLARFIGGKPTLEKPQFENKDDGKDDKKDGAARPAEAAS
jgi:hypothetical protein